MSLVTIPVHRGRISEMLARGYELVALPTNDDDAATMRGPDPDSYGDWMQIGALAKEPADA